MDAAATHPAHAAHAADAPPPGRPGLPRRIGVFLVRSAVVRIMVGSIVVIAATVGVQTLIEPLRWSDGVPLTFPTLALHLIGAVLMILTPLTVYAFFTRLTERQWPADLQTRRMPLELTLGIALGLALSATIVGILWAVGLYHVDALEAREVWAEILLRAAISNLAVAVVEETWFRAIMLRITQQRLGSWWAIGISSLFFGLIHISNPNATLASAISISVQAGILLGAVYIVTQRLWIAIGLHAAWNFMQQGVVGGALSGSEVHAICQSRLTGPAWLSGGAFGIEGSIIATTLCAGVGLLILRHAARTGKVVPRTWPARRTPN